MGFRQCIEVVYGMYPPILRYLIVLAFTLHILGVARYVNKELNTNRIFFVLYPLFIRFYPSDRKTQYLFTCISLIIMPYNYGYLISIKDFVKFMSIKMLIKQVPILISVINVDLFTNEESNLLK
jgi:hypothetical protein